MLVRPFVLLALAAPLLPAADAELLGWLPPATNFVIGVKVRNLVDSDLGRAMSAEAAAAATPQWSLMLAALGFDPTKDIDEVVIAVAGTGKNPPTLLAARGRFAGLRAVLAKQKNADKVTFVDDNTILGGDPALVRAALRRGSALPAPMAKRAAAFASRYDVYAVGVPALPAGEMPAALNQIGRFQFGMAVTSGLELTAELDAPTPAKARELEALVMGSLRGQKNAEEILKLLKLEVEGKTLRATMSVPAEVMQKAIRESIAAAKASPSPLAAMMASMGGAPLPAGATRAAPPPTPEVPSRVPAGAALVITGSESDGGTIVVKRP